ncbi:MAG: hypothetical protein GY780_01860 [bacterium]|nr:hypothetical protein [bacterium]
MRTHIIWLLLLLLLSGVAHAQNEPIFGSTSDVADLSDPFAYGLNPALGEMTLQQISAGFQILHLGLLENSTDLNTGGLIYTTRKFNGGLSLDANYLNTPLWGVKKFRAGYGRRVYAGLSLGLSLGLDQRSFDLSDADLNQGSHVDPLLTGGLSRTVATTTLAAAYSLPWQGVTVSALLENPHQPNISLGGNTDNVYLPATLRAGASWERKLFSLNAGIVDRQWRTTYSASARGNIYGRHSVLAKIDSDHWALGARVSVGSRAWLEYSYTNPTSELGELTSGSHGIVISWHASGKAKPAVRYNHDSFDDAPYSPVMQTSTTDFFPEAEAVAVAPVDPTHGFFTVEAVTDTALIRVKRLRRVFGPSVDMARVRRLPRWRIGVIDSTWSDRITWDITEGMVDAYPENDLPRGNYSDEYRASMDSLNRDLKSGSGGDLLIVADENQLDRARYLARKAGADSLQSGRVQIKRLQPIANENLRRQLIRSVGNDSIPAVEEISLRQFPSIAINIHSLGDVVGTRAWTMEISDSLERPVRQFQGVGNPPEQVLWNWLDSHDELVDVDQYTYQLKWVDAQGNRHFTIAREITIARQVMQRTLEFGVEKTPLRELQKRQPVLILDPGRKGLSVAEEGLPVGEETPVVNEEELPVGEDNSEKMNEQKTKSGGEK